MMTDSIVKLIVSKGIGNVNLSMFSGKKKKDILQQAAEALLRQGKTTEVVRILEDVDVKKFADMLRPVAEQCLELGDFSRAALIYEKIGDREMSQFIKANLIQ